MPVDASYFMFSRVFIVVDDAIYSRLLAFLTGLKFFASVRAHTFPSMS